MTYITNIDDYTTAIKWYYYKQSGVTTTTAADKYMSEQLVNPMPGNSTVATQIVDSTDEVTDGKLYRDDIVTIIRVISIMNY